MMKLRDAAKSFVPKQTKNIADLEIVNIDVDLYDDGTGVDENGKEYFYAYVLMNNEEYRVPNSVVSQLKSILSANPNLQKFKVSKAGEGLKTRYTVVPIL